MQEDFAYFLMEFFQTDFPIAPSNKKQIFLDLCNFLGLRVS